MEKIISCALSMAKQAFQIGETPVGAIVFRTQTKEIISKAHNLVLSSHNPSAHAEILAIQQAGKILSSSHLEGLSIFATLEPCAMCATAISWAKLDRLYFGAYDIKSGAVENGAHIFQFCHHKPQIIGGLHEQECAELLTRFFNHLRKEKND